MFFENSVLPSVESPSTQSSQAPTPTIFKNIQKEESNRTAQLLHQHLHFSKLFSFGFSNTWNWLSWLCLLKSTGITHFFKSSLTSVMQSGNSHLQGGCVPSVEAQRAQSKQTAPETCVWKARHVSQHSPSPRPYRTLIKVFHCRKYPHHIFSTTWLEQAEVLPKSHVGLL